MITLESNIGMASKYLLTDPDRMLAIKENPYFVISNEKLGIREFSECLATINNHNISSSFLKWGTQKLEAQQFETFLDDLINERRTSLKATAFNNPLLIISKGIDHKPIVAMKVLKIRGICDLLAIDVSSVAFFGESIFRLGNELRNEELYKKDFYTIYKPPKRLCIVSGVTKTVISTEYNINQILRNFPGLVTKYDKTAIQEPLM